MATLFISDAAYVYDDGIVVCSGCLKCKDNFSFEDKVVVYQYFLAQLGNSRKPKKFDVLSDCCSYSRFNVRYINKLTI